MGHATFSVVEQTITLGITNEVSVILLVVQCLENMFALVAYTSFDEIIHIDDS